MCKAVLFSDIQGLSVHRRQVTGAITLATLTSAIGVTGTVLSEQTIVLYSTGSAGIGIVRQVRDAAVAPDGIDKAEATEMFRLVDKHGLVTREMAT